MRSMDEILRPESASYTNRKLIALLALSMTAIYMLMHPYQGLIHDARLYALQALNHLRPDLYGTDLFLRYGSQDDYTLFTPLYGWLISVLGIESAAALLTFVSHMAFLAAAAFLARIFLPTAWMFTALILLLLLPDHYGPSLIFSYLEDFMTARLPAEALALTALTAWMLEWRITSIAMLVCAMLTHPIIGLASAVVVITKEVLIPHWRRILPLAALAIAGVSALKLADWIPEKLLLSGQWREIVLSHARYVSLLHWSSDDWGRAATVVTTLFIAVRVSSGALRRLALATLVATSVMLLVSLVGGDLLQISLVVQAQPWRILWLATVIAIIAMPMIAAECLPKTNLRRVAFLLLAAAWLSPIQAPCLLLAPLAAASIAQSGRTIGVERYRLLERGSWLVVSATLLHGLALALLSVRANTYSTAVAPWLDVLRGAAGGGTLLAVVLFSCFWLVKGSPRAIPVAAALVLFLIALAAWPTATSWLQPRFDDSLRTAFEPWRTLIPPGSDVLWAADRSLGPNVAISSWLLLERPSYVSLDQTTTALFSREAALEIERRTQTVLGVLPDIASLYPRWTTPIVPDPVALAPACSAISAKYIVSRADFIDAIPVHAPESTRAPYRYLKLYTCP